MPRFHPRISVRRMMIVVAIVGVASWLSITAVRVALDPNAEQMSHLRLQNDTRELQVHTHPIQGTFWPRYRRRLLGQPWPGSYLCPSCREDQERRSGHSLIDIASYDDGAKMVDRMGQLNQQRDEARMRAAVKRSGR